MIGCGAVAGQHLYSIADMADAELVAVCDIKEERAKKASELGENVAVYTDWEKMIREADIDVCHICTPHYLHVPMAVECLRRGINVLTEKPCADNVENGEKLLREAEKSTAQCGVCFQNRYNLTSRVLKQKLDSGEYGKILGARAFVTWHREDGYYTESGWRGKIATEGGGVMMNQAIHTLDLVRWLLGDVEQVQGKVASHWFGHINDTEDTAEIAIRFKSGARGIVFATVGYVTDSPVFIEIVTEKAVFTLCDTLTVKGCDGQTEVFRNLPGKVGAKAYWGTCHEELIQDFYRCVEQNKPFPIPVREAMKSLRMIDQLYTSSRKE